MILGWKLDASRAMTALCSSAMMLIAYWIALRLEWNAALAGITVAIMYGATWGATLKKALVRMLATVLGAAVAVVMVAVCAHDRELFIAAMSLWTALCVWGVQDSHYPYGWLITLLTSAILGWPGGLNPTTLFDASVVRVSTTILGLLLAGLAFGILWPLRADRQFEAAVDKLLTDTKRLLSIARARLLKPEQAIEEAKALQAEIILRSTSLPQLLAEARVENSTIRRFDANYEVLCERLEDFALAAAATASVVVNDDAGLLSAEDSRRNVYPPLFGELEQCCDRLLERFALAREGKPIPQPQEADRDRLGSWLSDHEKVAPPAERLLVERCRLFHRSASQTLNALGNLQTLPEPNKKRGLHAASHVDWKTKLRLSMLAVVQLVVGTYFLLLMNWPLSLHLAIVPIAVLVFKNSLMPVSLATGILVKALLTILPVAACFHFLIMPHFDSFWELAPPLAILFFCLMYGMSSPIPFRSLICLIQVIVINILISVSATPPVYSFSTFANLYLGLSGAFLIVILLASVFETRNPRVGLLKLVRAICNELSSLFKDAPSSSGSALDGDSRKLQHTLLNQYKQMNQLRGVINYQARPGIQTKEIKGIIDAAGTLILRVIWMDNNDQFHECQSRDLDTLQAWYAGTLAAAGQSLSELRSVSVDALDEGPLHRLDSGEPNLLEHRSLVDALTDFQRKLNALDWEKWTRAYF